MSTPLPINGQKYAAIYARVSTKEQNDKGFSIPTQIDASMALAKQDGYTVSPDHIFIDDYTGLSLNRPEFRKLRELAREGVVQAIVVHDDDRLSRKLAHLLLLQEEFEQAAVQLRIVTRPSQEKTPETQLLSNVRGIIAEYERAKILERTARGRRGRVQAGYVPGGRRTLGYRYVKHPDKGAHYEIHPEEAALVRRIFWLYVTQGLSHEAIAALLTQEGIPTPGARQSGRIPALSPHVWARPTIAFILHNATYLGTLHYGKKVRLPGKKNPDKKTRWQVAPADTLIPVCVPPLIDPETFAAAQAQMLRNTQQSQRNRQHDYLFVSGRLRCGQCGCAMSGARNGEQHARYRCSRRPYQDVVIPHVKRSVMASAIEPLIWNSIAAALNNPTLIATEVEKLRTDATTSQAALDHQQEQYLRQLSACAEERKLAQKAYYAKAIKLHDFKAKQDELDMRQKSAEDALTTLKKEQRLIDKTHQYAVALSEYYTRVRQKFQRFDLVEKHLALEALGITVVWYPDRQPEIQSNIPIVIEDNAPRCIVPPAPSA